MWKQRLEPKLIRLEEIRIKDGRIAPLPHLVTHISLRGTREQSDRTSPVGYTCGPMALHDLAWNDGVFVTRVDRA